ncbi:hypothetical protein [Bartonella sp. B41]
MKSNLHPPDALTYQRKLHLFYNVLEYILIIAVGMSAILATLISVSDRIKLYF